MFLCPQRYKKYLKHQAVSDKFCTFGLAFFCSLNRTFAPDMPFPIHINIVDLVFKGMLIGMIASAPMGPVGILCVQRTLNKGRWFGMVTGIGAAISDIFYAGIRPEQVLSADYR